ncbi:ubiquinol-cytochrome c reductase iron-sulfur subunit [Blastococcus sp. Marseille-P5729]|uniref:cytochrome bc1 complex Rieske iron-sulfur subunit n=1 Tax=Blastococcus sp. Marseille-P5729 TaxID=2086582 RepID=UPI000D102421|nr:Rieske 2Fe-2S domain-containing protein [Blastococcus sp. Marseille-P5729]
MSGFNQPPADEPEEVIADPVDERPTDRLARQHAAGQRTVSVTEEELSELSDAELVELGGKMDGVTVLSQEYPYAAGSRAEKRAERRVALCFGLAALFGLLFVAAFLFWPWRVNDAAPTEWSWAQLYTPILGLTLGLALTLMGAGLVIWAKKLMPHEVSIQDRHEGASPEIERRATAATLTSGAEGLGLNRRKMIRGSLLGAGGILGLATIIPLGGLINNPYRDDALFHTAWKKGTRLLRANGTPIRPGDMAPGSLETVYPYTEGKAHQADTPTMLIRMHHDQAQQFKARPMNELEEWGGPARWNEYVAYSKICSHLGCPVSLYERETGRILCPCHQSQFQIVEDAKPVFGPATRSLPALPIEVDDEGYFVAKSDYREPVGPAFWDRQRGVTKNAE